MKKHFVRILAAVLMGCMLSACGSGGKAASAPAESTTPSSQAPATEEKAEVAVSEISLFNNKVEIDDALKQYAQTYEQLTGVKVNVTSYGGGGAIDSFGMLKTMSQSGDLPEIFVIAGPTHYEQFKEYICDLSDQEWTQYTEQAYLGENGEVVGFPVAIEGYGLAYNARILKEAGVDPNGIKTFSDIKSTFETIDAIKDELGLNCVVSMAASPELNWVTGEQNFNVYLSGGLARDDDSMINALLSGQVDEQRLRHYADYVELLFQYANSKTMTVATYDAQVSEFALEKAAFVHQGNWIDPTLKESGIDFEMGYVPQAFLPTATNGIFISAPTWYVVNSQSPGAEEAKKFLNSIAMTEEGHDYMVNIASMVPAFTNVKLTPAGRLSADVMRWNNEGEAYSWNQYHLPDGFALNTLAPIFEQFAAGSIDKEGFIAGVTKAINSLK